MTSTLAESIELLVLDLVPKLVAPDRVLGLKILADRLAPVLRGGFECRLNSNTTQVDFQQCIIVPNENELALLQEQISDFTSGDGVTHAGWLQLQDFLAQWQLSLHAIPEIWLEYDIDKPSVFLPLPSIFFGLPQEVSPALETYAIATQSLDLLLGCSGWHEWQDNIEQCFRACPDGVFISHIGVMLSRNSPALRVNVKRLQPDFLIPYLQEIGWQEETKELQILMTQLFGLVDRITVCLDIGQIVYPQIGLECIFLQQPPDESRWSMFFDYLVERGLCLPEKKEALLSWPGQTNPLNAKLPWPSDLITASLLQPRDRFTIFDRRLSHIKVVWRSPDSLEAKAYLWFEHQWLSGKSKQ